MVSSTRLVGRDAELSTLRGWLDRAGDGAPGLVVVAGDAGLGKTRFVREVAAGARADGWTVLAGGCVELSEGAATLAPVAQVLRQLARDRGDEELARLLAGRARRLARLVPELAVDTHGLEGGSAGQVLASFHRLLRTLADEAPVLLVLEDLHWADVTTHDLLRHLSSRLYDERLLVLATVRTDDLDRRHPFRPVLAEMVRRPEVHRVDLGPLDAPSLAEHLARLTAEQSGRDLVAIAERAGGNPFFAEELLEVGEDGGPAAVAGGGALAALAAVARPWSTAARGGGGARRERGPVAAHVGDESGAVGRPVGAAGRAGRRCAAGRWDGVRLSPRAAA